VHRRQRTEFLTGPVAYRDDEVAVLLYPADMPRLLAAQRQVMTPGGGDRARGCARGGGAPPPPPPPPPPGRVPADAAGTLLARRHSAAARCERAELAVHTNNTRRALRDGGRLSESSAPGTSRR
jgi:hypothetical protein